jgi:DNA (cytosine-5)-methyltransferase 1
MLWFRRNSPETVVYNNCANVVLRYALKSHEKHELEAPKDIRGIKTLPAPPVPGEIDIIMAGFPWYQFLK